MFPVKAKGTAGQLQQNPARRREAATNYSKTFWIRLADAAAHAESNASELKLRATIPRSQIVRAAGQDLGGVGRISAPVPGE